MKKKTKKPFTSVIRNETYDHDLLVFYKRMPGYIIRKLREQGFWEELDDEQALKWASLDARTQARVLYGKDKIPRAIVITDMSTLDTIAHESFHLVYAILESRGLKLCYESEEAFAYLISWYFKMILSQVNKVLDN